MPKNTESKSELKVTDRRLFTPDGDLREEYRGDVEPADPERQLRPERPAAEANKPPEKKPASEPGASPGTQFAQFVESLMVNAYMALGMIRNPYQPQSSVDLNTARQMIDILAMLKEKTEGNLTPAEADFITTHLAELRLHYVQKTKAI